VKAVVIGSSWARSAEQDRPVDSFGRETLDWIKILRDYLPHLSPSRQLAATLS
jgi:hypothetical protein